MNDQQKKRLAAYYRGYTDAARRLALELATATTLDDARRAVARADDEAQRMQRTVGEAS